MKRNWDTIRDILKRLEEPPPEGSAPGLPGYPEERAGEIAYHLEILIEAGLVLGRTSKSPGQRDFQSVRLTWQGHELLDAIRNDVVWQRTKKTFAGSGLSMTMDLMKSVAADIAASTLKSPLSG